MKVIFLDIDGVLNAGHGPLDPAMVDRLNRELPNRDETWRLPCSPWEDEMHAMLVHAYGPGWEWQGDPSWREVRGLTFVRRVVRGRNWCEWRTDGRPVVKCVILTSLGRRIGYGASPTEALARAIRGCAL